MNIHESWIPVCVYCGEKITFKFEFYGHVCINKKCEFKHIPLVDLGFRNSKSEGWCAIITDREFAYYKKPYHMKRTETC